MSGHLRGLGIAAVLLGVATAPAAVTYRDAAGDVRGGAGPDVTAITVSHTSSALTFRVRFANAPPLRVSTREGWGELLLIGLDTPPRSLKRTTHGWLGADYYLGAHATDKTAVLLRASGRGTVLARPKLAVAGRTLTITVSRRLLGDPAWLEFAVAAGRESRTGGGSDEAPARGAFHYSFSARDRASGASARAGNARSGSSPART